MIDRITIERWLRQLTAAKARIDERCDRQRSMRHMTYDLEFLIGDMKSELERLPDIGKELEALRAETVEVDTSNMLTAMGES